jgi:RNA polymerase sigma-70 factor (ECF subfamily)
MPGIAVESFDEIVRLYQKRIYRVLFLLLSDRELADDLTQECFLRAYKKRAGFRGDAQPYTWLLQIALNLARDHRRSRRNAFWRMATRWRRSEAMEERVHRVADGRSTPEQKLLALEKLKLLRSAVGRLPDRQRVVFLLRFIEELSLDEIARAMNLKVGTVKTHLFRATGAVRRDLNDRTSE